MPGELQDDSVLVRAQSEANRIYNKGRYGRPLSGGALRLDLVEAAYLVETGRLTVEWNGGVRRWADLLVEASHRDPGFEIRYLVYRDYRERGLFVSPAAPPETGAGAHFRYWERGTEKPGAPAGWILAASERSHFSFAATFRFAREARAAKAEARLSLVDEESDLTHYGLGLDPPAGGVPPEKMEAVDGNLLADRVLVPDPDAAKTLHGREFFGKPLSNALQLSLVEALSLQNRGALRVRDAPGGKPLSSAAMRKHARGLEPQIEQRLGVYEDLKARGLVVKTGFKFGTHFRAYERRPEEGHAPYLIQAVGPDFASPWEPLARAIRLSHSVRKKFLLATVEKGGAKYLSFGRLRF